jgi:hypothetical protein
MRPPNYQDLYRRTFKTLGAILTTRDRIPPETIASAEKKLGLRLPKALREVNTRKISLAVARWSGTVAGFVLCRGGRDNCGDLVGNLCAGQKIAPILTVRLHGHAGIASLFARHWRYGTDQQY